MNADLKLSAAPMQAAGGVVITVSPSLDEREIEREMSVVHTLAALRRARAMTQSAPLRDALDTLVAEIEGGL